MSNPVQTCSLSEYLGRISEAIKANFGSSTWIHAEVVSVRTHTSGHVYFELAEYDSSGKELAKVKATLWARQAEAILRKFSDATGGRIRDGIKISALMSPSFHAQFGFSLSIQDIDPAYTLGDMEVKLAMIRESLKTEGIYDLNKKLPAPYDFFSVVVVSPSDAAGLGDFRKEADVLEAMGVVRFHYVSGIFQGSSTVSSLKEAFRTAFGLISETGSQALIIIRGGGAKTDLAYLNELILAQLVCRSPVPVLAGIGHERDSTILDEVAMARFDTPSKVINHIVATVCQNADDISKNMVSLMRDSDKKVSSILEILNTSIRGVTDLASRLFEREMTALTGYLRQAFDFAGIACDKANQSLDREMEAVLGLHPKKILQQGFSIARHSGRVVSRASGLIINEEITLDFYDGSVSATITSEPILKEKSNE